MNALFQISAAQPLTAAALLALLPTLNVTPQERRDFATAIATTVSIAGKPAEAVPFDCPALNRLLYGAPPRVLGLSPDRLGEVASLLRRLLRLVGQHAPLERGSNGLTPDWKALHDALASRFRQMLLMSRVTLSDVLLTSELDGLPSSASRRL